jgi:hypothetical protein
MLKSSEYLNLFVVCAAANFVAIALALRITVWVLEAA